MSGVLAALCGCGGEAERHVPAQRETALSAADVERVKGATAWLSLRGKYAASGSATLFRREGNVGYLLATSWGEMEGATLTLRFHSGTLQAFELPAEMVSLDAGRNVACLRVEGENLPEPLELAKTFDLPETSVLFAAGYPGQPNMSAPPPIAWVVRTSVAGIERDRAGVPSLIRLPDVLALCTQGGPVVDERLRVLAIAVHPGLQPVSTAAVPCDSFALALAAKLNGPALMPGPAQKGRVSVGVRANVVDPFRTLKSASIAWIRRSRTGDLPTAGAGGVWPRAAEGMTEVPLALDAAAATGEVALDLEEGDGRSILVVFQLTWTLQDGAVVQSMPMLREIVFEEGVAAGQASTKPLPEMVTGDVMTPVATWTPRSVLTSLHLCRDRERLFVLDLSDGRIVRLRASDLTVAASADAGMDPVAMSLNPREDMVYVAARDGGVPDKTGKRSGVIRVFRASTLEPVRTVPVAVDPLEIVVTDAGLAVVSDVQSGAAVVDTAGSLPPELILERRSQLSLRLHPDQRRVCAGDRGSSPGDFYAIRLDRPTGYSGPLVAYDSPFHGQHPLGNIVEISAGGDLLLGAGGGVVKLTPLRAGDMGWAGDTVPWTAAAAAPGTSSFFAATSDGFIKQYALADLKLKKSLNARVACQDLEVDPEGVLFAITAPLPDPREGSRPQRPLTEIRSWSLKAK